MNKWTAALMALIGLMLAAGCTDESGDDGETTEDAAASGIEGVWEGAITVPNQEIPIIVEFTGDEGTLSIPSQGVSSYPLSTLKFEDPELAFDVTLQGQRLLFEGQLQGESIEGTFAQQGQKFPFELVRGAKEQPADPETIIETEVEGGVMKAVTDLPDGDGPHPAAVLIAGSGPTDKNGNSIGFPGKNDSLKMLAEELTRQGIAVIRYDKRGIGDNAALGKTEENLRFEDYTKDAAAWIRFAKADDRFSDVSVIGHSEGALVGLVAANQEGIDSYVSLAGVGRPAGDLLREQLRSLPTALSEEAEAVLSELEAGRTVDEVSPELQQLFRPSVQPYLQSWMAYDPLDEASELDAPALFVGGGRDLQVPASDAELLHEAKPDSELFIADDMNHVLKKVSDNDEENRDAYADPDFPLADGLSETVADFLKN